MDGSEWFLFEQFPNARRWNHGWHCAHPARRAAKHGNEPLPVASYLLWCVSGQARRFLCAKAGKAVSHMSMSKILNSAVATAKETLQSLVELDPEVAKAADLIEQCLRAGKKLLVCGNGGSATDAAHFATELVVRFTEDRRAYPAICLAADGGLLTAAGNDYGFDEIFARQVAAFGLSGDVLICLTTSGKSKNVKRALEEAKARKLKTIAFLGRDGGSTIGMADVELLVRSDSTARIQEAHQLLLHVLCEIAEARLPRE
jgi:D-sedoheptulose 7-phosphate isomerase